MELSEEQLAFTPWLLNQKARCLRLTGYAGSGKTTVMRKLAESWEARNIMWCAPHHPAKLLLAKSIGSSNVHTVSAALGLRPETINGRSVFVPSGRSMLTDMRRNAWGKTLLVIDESSMLSRDNVRQIISSDVDQILFVGDPAQIPPVKEYESPIYSSDRDYPTYHLSRIFRQKSDAIKDLASDIREYGTDTTAEHGIANIYITDDNLAEFYKNSDQNTMVLCPTHTLKEYCNNIARKAFNLSGDGYGINERLLIESTNQTVGVHNGDIVTIAEKPVLSSYMGFKIYEIEVNNGASIKIPANIEERKRVKARRDMLPRLYNGARDQIDKENINVEVELLNEIIFASSGYAMTIHASQGSTFNNVMVFVRGIRSAFEDDNIRRRMMYTAVTRASQKLTIGR